MSAEDEYLTEDDPEPDYTAELILAIAELTDKQRFVIECRYGLRGDPLTVREIAALMGVRYQAVWNIERRAIKRLSKGLTNTSIFIGQRCVQSPRANVERA